jgi:hypothetical protein
MDLDLENDELNPNRAIPILALYPGDVGELQGREETTQFKDRKPECVSGASPNGLTLTITNVGDFASDPLVIDYQIVYCTLSSHGPRDGFTTEHAEKFDSAKAGAKNVDIVPAAENGVPHTIDFPPFVPPEALANIYFRARIRYFGDYKPPQEWAPFSVDPMVTEFHIPVAPR